MKYRFVHLTIAGALLLIVYSCSTIPESPGFRCQNPEAPQGKLVEMNLQPKNIFGFGLTYPGHIQETQCGYRPGDIPPIFKKNIIALNQGHQPVRLPTTEQITAALEEIEPGIATRIREEYGDLTIPPMMDYEVELALVLLDDVAWENLPDKTYMPAVGFFLVNDLSARSLAVLGEGMVNKTDYWGISKSFPGFLPAGKKVWIPDIPEANTLFCTPLTTRVNGKIRQQQMAEKQLYTPKELLAFIYANDPADLPAKGDVILTGTPAGVALQVPKWKRCLANFFGIGRFTKLAKLMAAEKDGDLLFLKAGDTVEISGGDLGDITVVINAAD